MGYVKTEIVQFGSYCRTVYMYRIWVISKQKSFNLEARTVYMYMKTCTVYSSLPVGMHPDLVLARTHEKYSA